MILEDWEPNQTELKLRCFVLASNGITMWGMYQQALRELAARRRGVRETIVEYVERFHDLENLNGLRRWKEDGWLADYSFALVSKLRELAFLMGVVTHIKQHHSFDAVKEELHFWETKFKLEIGLRIECNQPITTDLVSSIRVLPSESRRRLENALANIDTTLGFARSFVYPKLPEIEVISGQTLLKSLNAPNSATSAIRSAYSQAEKARNFVESDSTSGLDLGTILHGS